MGFGAGIDRIVSFGAGVNAQERFILFFVSVFGVQLLRAKHQHLFSCVFFVSRTRQGTGH